MRRWRAGVALVSMAQHWPRAEPPQYDRLARMQAIGVPSVPMLTRPVMGTEAVDCDDEVELADGRVGTEDTVRLGFSGLALSAVPTALGDARTPQESWAYFAHLCRRSVRS